MCVKYVCSFVARECLSHRVKMNFNFTLPLDKTIERPPPIPQPAFLLPPLAPSASARDIRSRRDWERDAKKWVPTRRYASPWCLPRILRPSPTTPFPLCWSTLPAPLGTLENVTKILYWCLLLFVVVGALFLYFISFFSAFLMMLLKAIHKISHTATHNGNSSSRRGCNKICVN